jgi:hypothetical protein
VTPTTSPPSWAAGRFELPSVNGSNQWSGGVNLRSSVLHFQSRDLTGGSTPRQPGRHYPHYPYELLISR